MAADANELALRYLLQLSSDIRSAVLLERSGRLLGCAPAVSEAASAAAGELAREAVSFQTGDDTVELDVTCERESVMVLADDGLVLVCVADRTSLPGIVVHEMRTVLDDIGQGSGRRTTENGT